MDLFTPVVEAENFHPNFRAILKSSKKREREELQRWATGFPDRDGKFVKEFQTSFNSSFWELYLYAVFRDFEFDIDWKYASPDFNISSGDKRYVVEATTANHSQGKTAEWEGFAAFDELREMRFKERNRESIIRLSNAFVSKARLYHEKYSNLEHVKKKPFIIAIAPFEQPNFNLQYNRPITALLYDYYVDEDAYLDDKDAYRSGPPGISLGFVEKDNGAELELGFFLDDAFREVSAVIFSCTATWGKVEAMTQRADADRYFSTLWGAGPNGVPEKRLSKSSEYSERIRDGLQIYHNPYALRPIDPAVFRKEGVVQVFGDPRTRELMWEGEENCLMYRLSHNLKVEPTEDN